MGEKTITVSIRCTVYNHGRYLRQCLESLVNQHTTFNYEIIVHDDASKDDSPSIIKEYAEKYPDKIIPIYEKENQYSKDKGVITKIMDEKCRGRYIAWCEGDDLWHNSNKLQIQVNSMNNNPSCHLCVCSVKGISEDGSDNGFVFPESCVGFKKGIIDSRSFINIVSHSYSFQTSGYLVKSEDWNRFRQETPDFKRVAPVGDEPLLLYFGQLGDVFYIDESLSSYRMNSLGSWSERKKKWTSEQEKQHKEKFKHMIMLFDEYTQGRFHDICEYRLENLLCIDLAQKGDYKELIKHKRILKDRPLKSVVYYYMAAYLPFLVKK